MQPAVTLVWPIELCDIILFAARAATTSLFCSSHMEEIPQHCQALVKLRKGRLFPTHAGFLGVDVTKEGCSPAESKHEQALRGLERPLSCTDLRL